MKAHVPEEGDIGDEGDQTQQAQAAPLPARPRHAARTVSNSMRRGDVADIFIFLRYYIVSRY
jgi:hypothetical protein